MGDEEGPLPPGWAERFDANTQRKYYVNLAARTSQWERPVADPPVPVRNLNSPLQPLPRPSFEKSACLCFTRRLFIFENKIKFYFNSKNSK